MSTRFCWKQVFEKYVEYYKTFTQQKNFQTERYLTFLNNSLKDFEVEEDMCGVWV